jgi:NAD(P)-dependent dehydrogenase (short-subunit alcohol dehydrogenase family)
MKNGKLAGQVAVVTGASKGIGADIAKHLPAEGAAVVVNYASSKEGADRVVDEIAKGDGKAIAVQANVARKAEVERLFSATDERRRRCHHSDAGQGTWAAQYPRQRHQSWDGGNRRSCRGRFPRNISPTNRSADTAWSHRSD